MIDNKFRTTDGLKLVMREWVSVERLRGVIAVVHGIGEHCGRYEGFALDMNRRGYGVIGFDQRGHGLSEGARGHTPSYQNWMKDIDCFLSHVRQRVADHPVFLFGHSLGGVQVLAYILRNSSELSGAIVSSPYLRTSFKIPRWKDILGRAMARVFSRISLSNGLHIPYISRNPAVIQAYQEDALIHDRISAGTYLAMTQLAQWVMHHPRDLKIPLLLLHGTEDHITDWSASREFCSGAGSLCRLKPVTGAYHELLNDLCRDEVLKEIHQFVINL